MKHVIRLAIKFISCLIVLGVILGMFYQFSFADVLLITTFLGVISYFLGDLLILRMSNNALALAADFGLAFILIWFMGTALTTENHLFSASFISSVAVTAFEYFFHRYLNKDKAETTNQQTEISNSYQYQTEAADELAPVRGDVRSTQKNGE